MGWRNEYRRRRPMVERLLGAGARRRRRPGAVIKGPKHSCAAAIQPAQLCAHLNADGPHQRDRVIASTPAPAVSSTTWPSTPAPSCARRGRSGERHAQAFVHGGARNAGLDGTVARPLLIALRTALRRQDASGCITGIADPVKSAAALADRLPGYMVPAAVVVMDASAHGRRQAGHPRPTRTGISGPRPIPGAGHRQSSRCSTSTPRCSASNRWASTTRSSTSAGTASCRCRSWRGRGRQA